ncbi:MAG: hypothetical protein LBR51_01125 [Bacteroidales bacterium]|nr:hypothetical protein [Bacteroidales bacterium]
MKINVKYRARVAAVLAVLLFGTLLIKPLHLLVSADSHHAACHSETTSGDDCAICHFTFSNFATTPILTVEKPLILAVKIACKKEKSAILHKKSVSHSLRAPPVF